jgi:hypothetical protein
MPVRNLGGIVTTTDISCVPGTNNMHDGSVVGSGVDAELTGSESDALPTGSPWSLLGYT